MTGFPRCAAAHLHRDLWPEKRGSQATGPGASVRQRTAENRSFAKDFRVFERPFPARWPSFPYGGGAGQVVRFSALAGGARERIGPGGLTGLQNQLGFARASVGSIPT